MTSKLVKLNENRLVIIGFSDSLQDADEVEEVYGTEGYRAPEVDGGRFNPFQADTLDLEELEKLSQHLGSFDGPRHRLMLKLIDFEPQERPPQMLWARRASLWYLLQ